MVKIKRDCKLQSLFPETMKLLASTKKDVDQDKDGENVPKLESVEVVLVHCNLVNNNYQQTSKVLLTFVPDEQFGQLIDISPHSQRMLTQQIQNFLPSKDGLLIKMVNLLDLKIMLIWLW